MTLRLFFKALAALALPLVSIGVVAATRMVTSTSNEAATVGTLPYWLLNASDGDTLDCSAIAGQTITLTASLPAITRSYTINGAGITLDGASRYQAFQVAAGIVSINAVTIQNALSKGGDGGDGYSGGGGAVGGGGALYVHGGASVTLTASSLLNNVARGGNGGAATFTGNTGAGGGGGFGGGNGGSALTLVSTGGGGGGHSNGGDGGSNASINGGNGVYFGGAGGGAGINVLTLAGNGGNAGPTASFTGGAESGGNGGGGAGDSGNGVSATGTGTSGMPGTGGSGIGVDALYGAGGGGGGASESGNPGGAGLGAGGGGGAANYAGGPGGILGGGGGGGLGIGGGAGGFGAGGGGAVVGGTGGGGYAAGGGNGGSDPGGNAGGGGGSGLGGAIFIQANGNLVIADASRITGNSAVAGAGGSSTGSGDPGYVAAGNGAAMGNDIFVRQQGAIVFNVSNTLTIASPIEGDRTGGPDGSGGLQKIGVGTLNLGGANTYSGTTTVDAGTLNLDGSVIGNVVIGSAGTLSSNAGVAGSLATSGTVLATINSLGSTKVAVSGAASLAGILKIALSADFVSGTYEVLTASSITGTFDAVRFIGASPAQFAVSYLPDGALMSVQIRISRAGAAVSTTALSFGDEVLNASSAPKTVTLTNTGQTALTVLGISTDGDFSQTGTCTDTLAIGGSCVISVSFRPTTAGVRSGHLTIVTNALSSPDIVNLDGTGVSPQIHLSTAALDFGQTLDNQLTWRNLTLTNEGTGTLRISRLSVSPAFSAQSSCGNGVPAGASCNVLVIFKPLAFGSMNGVLLIDSNAVNGPVTISLKGENLAEPANGTGGGTMDEHVLVLLGLAAWLRRRSKGRTLP